MVENSDHIWWNGISKGEKSKQLIEIGLRKLLRALICDLTLKLFKFEMLFTFDLLHFF